MERIRMKSAARGLAILLAVWACQLVIPAASLAQETEEPIREKRVVVEVRDGKVFINGEESEVGDEGRIVVRKGDGDEVVVVMEKDGPVWFSAFSDARRGLADAERARTMARYHVARPNNADFFMEFDPDLERLEEMDIQGRLSDAFAGVDGLRENLFRLQRQSEELREKEAEIREKAREVRRAEEGDRATLEAELDAMIAEAFDMKLADERREIEQLERRLTELQTRLRERDERRREIIERRKKDLLGRRDNLDW